MPAAIIPAAVGAVGSVAGGVASGKGAKKAARIQAQAAADQQRFLTNQYNQNAARFSPEISAGTDATARLQALLGMDGSNANPTEMLRATPGYQFMMSEGLRGVNANAYSRGLGNSGATQRALMEVGQGIADQTFNTHVGQVSSIADRGAGAKSALAGVSQNFANNYTGVTQNAADSASNAALAQSANFNNVLSGVLRSGGQVFSSSYGGGSLLDSVRNMQDQNGDIF